MFRTLILVMVFVWFGCKTEQKVVVKPVKKDLKIDFSKGVSKKEVKVLAREIQWDKSSLRKVSDGLFGRFLKTKDGMICFYEHMGAVYAAPADEQLEKLGEAVKVADFPAGLAINPVAVNANNQLICFYIESPTEDYKNYFTLKSSFSTDGGKSWSAPLKVFQAGNEFNSGCWEPAVIAVGDELFLFFTNEYPYGETNEKEITALKSVDGGKSWSKPEKAVFNKGFRSGNSSVFQLQNGKVLLSYMQEPEEKSLRKGKPFIVDIKEGEIAGSEWAPFLRDMEKEDEGSDPVISQLPSGETILCIKMKDGGTKASYMQVSIGNDEARFFTYASEPFGKIKGVQAVCNSVIVHNDSEVTAVSSTEIDGKKGIWLIDGKVIRK